MKTIPVRNPINRVCTVCHTHFKVYQGKADDKFCSPKCSQIGRRVFNPSKELLQNLLWLAPTSTLGKIFGVSDKAVEKRAKLLKLEKPERGYWAKEYASGFEVDIEKIASLIEAEKNETPQ